MIGRQNANTVDKKLTMQIAALGDYKTPTPGRDFPIGAG